MPVALLPSAGSGEMLNLDDKGLMASVRAASDRHDADIYLYSGYIDDEGFGELATQIAASKARPNCVLILTTAGGSANSAYKIGRLIQKMYDEFILYVPSYCKSAGTIIALGTNVILMDVFSELGPLDVQLDAPDELGVVKSGLLVASALESLAAATFDLFESHMLELKRRSENRISFRLASELAVSLTAQLFEPIYAQISPDIIGSDHRDLSVAEEYVAG